MDDGWTADNRPPTSWPRPREGTRGNSYDANASMFRQTLIHDCAPSRAPSSRGPLPHRRRARPPVLLSASPANAEDLMDLRHVDQHMPPSSDQKAYRACFDQISIRGSIYDNIPNDVRKTRGVRPWSRHSHLIPSPASVPPSHAFLFDLPLEPTRAPQASS